ncbi:HD-GYP domain-containing protein [Paenibacillus sp. FSL H8-0537]|uniref:HD-GYP domain-containing protein n=1 Tax=Paenibacillus sp. FSL H8-0537 TaxID=2921399 RepID=UPI00310135D3
MKVHVTDLKTGDRLLKDTFNGYGLHVLSKGTLLENKEISKLLQHQIDYVEVESVSIVNLPERTLEQTVNPKWLPSVQPDYDNAIQGFHNLFAKASEDQTINEQEVEDAFQPLIKHLNMERDVVSMLLLLNTKDDYTYQHSVQVGMLAYYLATWLGYSVKKSVQIGKAGFLHDIGKSQIPETILNKPGKLTKEEFDEIKNHTTYGYDIIKKSFDERYIALSALEHHERNDGSGYPKGLNGDQIEPVSKLISVVDIYSAMISERVYQKKRDLFYVLKELYKLSFRELDPHITHTFIKHMIPNFIGKKAYLETGETGIIVMTHPTEFFRPLLQINHEFIDLTVERHLKIKEIFV